MKIAALVIGSVLMLTLPLSVVMHVLGHHGPELTPVTTITLTAIGAVVAFAGQFTKLLDGKTIKLPMGIEIKDEDDGQEG